MKKLVQSINTRNIKQVNEHVWRKSFSSSNDLNMCKAIITWATASQADSTTWQPVDVVLLLALGSMGSESSESELRIFENRSPDLRVMVEIIARRLQWRIVKTRSQAEFEVQSLACFPFRNEVEGCGIQNSLEMSEEERREKILEAKKIFDSYDQDGENAQKEALAAADVEMSDEEVAVLLQEYDEDGSGTISLDEFCQMQGLSLSTAEMQEFMPSSSEAGADSEEQSEKPGHDAAAQYAESLDEKEAQSISSAGAKSEDSTSKKPVVKSQTERVKAAGRHTPDTLKTSPASSDKPKVTSKTPTTKQ
eukprot:753587-Hanusia_phi.AAC.5